MNENRREELETLLIEWEDGSLDDAGVARLRQLLRDDPQARERFVELQMLVAAMHLENGSGLQSVAPQDPIAATTRIKPPRKRRTWATLLIATAASLLVCLGVGRWVVVESKLKSALQARTESQSATQTPDGKDPRGDRREATSHGVALVTQGATEVVPEVLEAGLELGHLMLEHVGLPTAAARELIELQRTIKRQGIGSAVKSDHR